MKVYKHFAVDELTSCVPELLTNKEKEELNIDPSLHCIMNEIGFYAPNNKNSWEYDCFNILTSLDEDFNAVEAVLFPIEKLPNRFKPTYKVVKEKIKTFDLG